MNYHDLPDLYQDGAEGTTSVGAGGLGMRAAERASVPSYNARKKKRRAKAKPDTLAKPSMVGTPRP